MVKENRRNTGNARQFPCEVKRENLYLHVKPCNLSLSKIFRVILGFRFAIMLTYGHF